ncbi:unnamed protein product [Durusdinium trenchii]|uniref:C2 domain-containing protein n=1 Tax=Durusdinium trenchii TaxID=1381693 RepID=A0ABP0JH31_9DINO
MEVMEENFLGFGKSTFCGDATVPVDMLLSGARTVSVGFMQTQPQPIPLYKRGENTGRIVVQILIHLPENDEQVADLTYVDTEKFVTPVQRLGVSGGTAPFFSLQLTKPEGKRFGDYWIGKDLSRATDEVQFYEKVKSLSKHSSREVQALYNFMFEYDGILKTTEKDVEDPGPLELLVLQNMRHGRKSLRLLDIKVGEKTAAANWKGKSRLAALRQALIDEHTNSQAEGFRLEGFDGQTPVLLSMDPLLDIGGEEGHSKSTQKKARRLMLQRLPAADMLTHFLDLHSYDPQKHPSSELAEVVLDEIFGLISAHQDGEGFSPEQEADLRKSVLVKIFDWGRSELNTLEEHSTRSAEEQQDRLDFWRLYVGGIQRLAWEAARAYRHRFGNSDSWAKVQLVVYDFDSMTDSDFMGQVFVDLAETPETTAPLLTADGAPVVGKEGEATITYSISWRRFHAASRLQGAWSVRIIRAEKLPVCDTSVWPLSGSSDPFVKVFAFSTEESYRCVQRSFEVWEETFDLPIGKPEHANLEAIVGSPKAEDFPIESRIAEAEGLKYWTELMHTICCLPSWGGTL